MRMTLLVHIAAGALGLGSGFIALSAAKGATVHRKAGIVFVCAMVLMSLSGAVIAALTGVETSVIMGLLTAYLVVTALMTVQPFSAGARWLSLGAMLVAFVVGLACVRAGIQALARPVGPADGLPAPAAFVFAAVAFLAGLSDVRMIRSGGLRGAPRLARHLWRMCLALFIAAGSFFLGQADEIPEPLRIPALLAIPVFVPLIAMLYWLWRVRTRRISRSIVHVSAQEAV